MFKNTRCMHSTDLHSHSSHVVRSTAGDSTSRQTHGSSLFRVIIKGPCTCACFTNEQHMLSCKGQNLQQVVVAHCVAGGDNNLREGGIWIWYIRRDGSHPVYPASCLMTVAPVIDGLVRWPHSSFCSLKPCTKKHTSKPLVSCLDVFELGSEASWAAGCRPGRDD